ncbi:MAG: hypothetical protein QM726_14645 [Chitinophagaceae bacterium]
MTEYGSYPPASITFKKGTAGAMQAYFDTAISVMPHGNNSIVIKLNYYKIPNRRYLSRRITSKKERYKVRGHDWVSLNADIYLQGRDSLFKLIMHLENQYPAYSMNLNESISYQYKYISTNICNYFERKGNDQKDTAILNNDTRLSYTIAALAAMPNNNYDNSLIFSATLNKNGFFKNFDDFRENLLTEADIKLDSVSNESVYHFAVMNQSVPKSIKKRSAWAIVYKGNCYIQMYNGSYLQLRKREHTFSFYVPRAMPDMYSMLCYENYKSATSGSSANYPSLWVIPIIIAVDAIIYYSIDKPAGNKILKAGLTQNYRYCSIDMYNGDFMYSDKE